MAGPRAAEPSDGIPVPSIATSLPANGDPTGCPQMARERGITYGVIYTGEALGNVSGGIRRGGAVWGQARGVSADLEKLIGWQGLSFFSNAFQIHRTSGLRDEHFTSLITIGNIEAFASTRLSELWFEQKLFDDRFSIRFGQLRRTRNSSSATTAGCSSAAIGPRSWAPTCQAADRPIRSPRRASDGSSMPTRIGRLLGLFNGDPGNQATVNRTGTNFRVNDPPLADGRNTVSLQSGQGIPRPGRNFRLGGWHHFGKFDDLKIRPAGYSLAHPLSNGTARQFRGTSGIYGIIDQQIYRPEGRPGQRHQRLQPYFGNPIRPQPGQLLHGRRRGVLRHVPRRPDDKFGASFIYARISDWACALDRDLIAFSGVAQPIRAYEMTIELSYQAQIKPGWTMQPTFEYVTRPGGQISDPDEPERPIKNGATSSSACGRRSHIDEVL